MENNDGNDGRARVIRLGLPKLDARIDFQGIPFHRVAVNFGPPLVLRCQIGSEEERVEFVRNGLLFFPSGGEAVLNPPEGRSLAPRGTGERRVAPIMRLLIDPTLADEAASWLQGVPAFFPRMRRASLALDSMGLATAQALNVTLNGAHEEHARMSEAIARALLIWVLSHRRDKSFDETIVRSPYSGIQRAVARIERDLDQKLSVQTLAHDAHMTPDNFARAFKVAVGMTPHQFLMKARLQKAQQLLSDLAHGRRAGGISEIALDAGFSSHSQFSTAFRRHTGLSPAEWAAQRPSKKLD